MTPETKLKNWTMNLLKENGWLVFKMHGGPYGRSGLPDLLAIKDGVHVWIELKVGEKQPSKIQQKIIERLKGACADVTVANDAIRALRYCEERWAVAVG